MSETTRKHVQNYFSLTSTSAPSSEDMKYGEIAVVATSNHERIYLKNSENAMVGTAMQKDIEEINTIIANNELTTAAALTDLRIDLNAEVERAVAKETEIESTIPTRISQLENDSIFLTSIPEEYVTETELNNKGYLTSIPDEYVTETELTSKKYVTNSALTAAINEINTVIEDDELVTAAALTELKENANTLTERVEKGELVTAAALTKLKEENASLLSMINDLMARVEELENGGDITVDCADVEMDSLTSY